jgi:hypothetical protein
MHRCSFAVVSLRVATVVVFICALASSLYAQKNTGLRPLLSVIPRMHHPHKRSLPGL